MGSMKAADLHRILTNAALFASTDKTVESLCVVRLELSGDQALAVATDRFTLGVARADYLGGEPFTFSLANDDVALVARMAKTPARDSDWRNVFITTDSVDDPREVTFQFTTGESFTARPYAAEFPKYRQLIPTVIPADNTELRDNYHTVGFTAAYLARFAKVIAPKGTPMRITTYSPSKPAVVRIGAEFLGLVMPVRIPDGDRGYSVPAWLTAAATVPVPA